MPTFHLGCRDLIFKRQVTIRVDANTPKEAIAAVKPHQLRFARWPNMETEFGSSTPPTLAEYIELRAYRIENERASWQPRRGLVLTLHLVALLLLAGTVWGALRAYEGFSIMAESAPGEALPNRYNAALGKRLALSYTVLAVIGAVTSFTTYYFARRLARNPFSTPAALAAQAAAATPAATPAP